MILVSVHRFSNRCSGVVKISSHLHFNHGFRCQVSGVRRSSQTESIPQQPAGTDLAPEFSALMFSPVNSACESTLCAAGTVYSGPRGVLIHTLLNCHRIPPET